MISGTDPVLELGAGFASSYALHGICSVTKRKIVTLESDKVWLSRFSLYQRPWHQFKYVTDFIDLPEYKEKWGMAFVDHGILGQRGLALAAVKDIPIIVAHDTCHEELNYTNKGVPQVLDSFKYRWDYKWQGPQTSVFSNSIDVTKLFRGLEL